MFAAWPGDEWQDAAYCGGCVRVTGPCKSSFSLSLSIDVRPLTMRSCCLIAGSVNVQITNKCPECAEGSLDLSTAAFSKIGNTNAGRSKQTRFLFHLSFSLACTHNTTFLNPFFFFFGRQKVPISWEWIDCDASKLETQPVSFVWKSGSSAYWVRSLTQSIRSTNMLTQLISLTLAWVFQGWNPSP